MIGLHVMKHQPTSSPAAQLVLLLVSWTSFAVPTYLVSYKEITVNNKESGRGQYTSIWYYVSLRTAVCVSEYVIVLFLRKYK